MDVNGISTTKKTKLGSELKNLVDAIEQIGDVVNKNAVFMN
jgi:hypothetical protein